MGVPRWLVERLTQLLPAVPHRLRWPQPPMLTNLSCIDLFAAAQDAVVASTYFLSVTSTDSNNNSNSINNSIHRLFVCVQSDNASRAAPSCRSGLTLPHLKNRGVCVVEANTAHTSSLL